MSPIPNRRPEWLPGALLLGAALGLALLVGLALGLRSWPPYVATAVAVLLATGWLERFRARRPARPAPRQRSRLKVVQGGKAKYDLASDDSTDDQRYLM